jgi:hypothetical protein
MQVLGEALVVVPLALDLRKLEVRLDHVKSVSDMLVTVVQAILTSLTSSCNPRSLRLAA